jgi:hypothetical protein
MSAVADTPKVGPNRGNAGKGRPKGAPNKTTKAAREAFEFAFQQIGGAKQLAAWAEDNQTEFFKLYARLVPQEVDGNLAGKLTVEIKSFA